MIRNNSLALAITLTFTSDTEAVEWKPYVVTAYSHGCTLPRSGKERKHKQKGANNQWPIANLTIAADRSIPFGTVMEFSYSGIVSKRIVGDRGHAITGNRIDLFMKDCESALRWGIRTIYARILNGREP